MIISAIPIWIVDTIGAVCVIVFSFLCLKHVRKLNQLQPNNLIFTYLLWVCYCLAGFAISRSAGHILKQMLIIYGYREIWKMIQPFSGSINTFMLIIVASITLFFERIWQLYQEILVDKKALQEAHEKLLDMNQNLEKRVAKRTQALAQSEKQIAQADKLASIGQLSSGIAHEINNPLGIILGYTQLMLRTEKSGTQKYEDLKTIEKHVKTCKAIVEDLLSFARSSKPKKEFINIHNIIEDAWNFVQHRSIPKGINVETKYHDNIPKMFMDEKKIKQVFINLIMNAIHAIGSSGHITLETKFHSKQNKVVIKISDSGHGIEEKNLLRIFDPFFTTKPTGEGTGLGLAVSYGIIKNHKGDIFVESIPGRQTVFTIMLPADKKTGTGD